MAEKNLIVVVGQQGSGMSNCMLKYVSQMKVPKIDYSKVTFNQIEYAKFHDEYRRKKKEMLRNERR